MHIITMWSLKSPCSNLGSPQVRGDEEDGVDLDNEVNYTVYTRQCPRSCVAAVGTRGDVDISSYSRHEPHH
jgi:cellulose synthase A